MARLPRITRRHFVQTAGAAAATVTLLPLSACRTDGAPPGPRRGPGGDGIVRTGNVVEVDLQAEMLDTTLAGTPVRLRSYNGTVPGPLIEVRPGDLLRVTLRNDLPPYDSDGWTGDHNVPHMLDTTNLHLHGLSVIPHLFDPVGTSDPDADMIAIRPGEALTYEIEIPDDQPDGLYWYHPHHHGSTAVQAVTGMAGGIIVRGAVDEVPAVAEAEEIVLVFNDIGLFPSQDGSGVYEYLPKQNAVWQTLAGAGDAQVTIWDPETQTMVPAPDLTGGFTGGDYALRYFLVNGQPVFREEHRSPDDPDPDPAIPPGCSAAPNRAAIPIGTQLDVPSFTLRPGQTARLRMLNANSDDLMPIAVEGHELLLIELDGVNLVEPRTLPRIEDIDAATFPDQQVLLASANRASVMFRAGAPGTYRVMQLAQCEQFLYSEARVLAEIEVLDDPIEVEYALPSRLPEPTREYPLITDDEIVARRDVTFSMAFRGPLNPIIGLDYMINGTLYDEEEAATVVALDTAEEWTLRVRESSEGHPFHIHVNSFEVISINGEDQPPGTIMDTVWVPADGEVVIRQRYKQWQGKAVYHCHILPHEDTGMMKNFIIGPPPDTA